MSVDGFRALVHDFAVHWSVQVYLWLGEAGFRMLRGRVFESLLRVVRIVRPAKRRALAMEELLGLMSFTRFHLRWAVQCWVDLSARSATHLRCSRSRVHVYVQIFTEIRLIILSLSETRQFFESWARKSTNWSFFTFTHLMRVLE